MLKNVMRLEKYFGISEFNKGDLKDSPISITPLYFIFIIATI